MSSSTNKLSRFWQELKRRKVIYVITVYASVSFVLIELVNNVLGPLNLPENLSTIVIIALAAAFPIVVLLSWIFDLTPKGIEKTRSSDELTQEEKVKTSNTWRIATYASIVIIIGLISLNIVNNTRISQYLKLYGKSIAVLPFVNDSPDKSNDYFINGTVDAIRDNLALLKDLKVMSRQSVEHYKASLIPIPEIAMEQEVAYILSGSMQKYGNQIRIMVQLYDANDHLIWSGVYDKEIREAKDQFSIQSEIAKLVSGEIKVVITPEEMQRIEKVPTTSIQANDFVLQAEEFLMINARDWGNEEALRKAENRFRKALTYDSAYAEAYLGLGFVNVMETFFRRPPDPLREKFADSILIYADIAFSLDKQLSDVYILRGVHSHYVKSDYYDALENYNKALELNPINLGAAEFRGYVLLGLTNYVEAIENWEKIIERDRGPTNLPQYLYQLANTYYRAGFPEIAALKWEDHLDYTGDSANYYNELSNLEYSLGNYERVVELKERANEIEPRSAQIFLNNYINAGLYDRAYEEAVRIDEEFRRTGGIDWMMGYAGYTLWNAGKIEEAEYLFNAYIESREEWMKQMNYHEQNPFLTYLLATVYAFTGNKEEAYEYLDLFANAQAYPLFRVTWFKNDPMFDSIRHEERFQKIMELVEGNYQAEHERVREWLEKTGRM